MVFAASKETLRKAAENRKILDPCFWHQNCLAHSPAFNDGRIMVAGPRGGVGRTEHVYWCVKRVTLARDGKVHIIKLARNGI